jgi:hypothetical protein
MTNESLTSNQMVLKTAIRELQRFAEPRLDGKLTAEQAGAVLAHIENLERGPVETNAPRYYCRNCPCPECGNTRPAVEQAAEQPKDYAEVVLRVEITSDTLDKVQEFTEFLSNSILETPSAAGADVVVTIHREGQLPVFETNRSPLKASGDLSGK